MIEITFERKDISVGKLPQFFRIPAEVLLRGARRFSVIGNVWDLAFVVTNRAANTARVLDNFKVSKEITPIFMKWILKAPKVELEKDFLRQYYEKFLNVTPQSIFKIGFQKIKKMILKNKENEYLVRNIPPNTLGSMMILLGVNWDVKTDWFEDV